MLQSAAFLSDSPVDRRSKLEKKSPLGRFESLRWSHIARRALVNLPLEVIIKRSRTNFAPLRIDRRFETHEFLISDKRMEQRGFCSLLLPLFQLQCDLNLIFHFESLWRSDFNDVSRVVVCALIDKRIYLLLIRNLLLEIFFAAQSHVSLLGALSSSRCLTI